MEIPMRNGAFAHSHRSNDHVQKANQNARRSYKSKKQLKEIINIPIKTQRNANDAYVNIIEEVEEPQSGVLRTRNNKNNGDGTNGTNETFQIKIENLSNNK
jgi:hypothetical protein